MCLALDRGVGVRVPDAAWRHGLEVGVRMPRAGVAVRSFYKLQNVPYLE